MFPDTANFSDPAYTEVPPDLGLPGLPSGYDWSTGAPPIGTQNQGPAAPVSGQPGSSLLGWLGLANNISQTVVNATRGGTPTTKRPATLTGSIASTGAVTLGVVALVFVLVVMALRRA